jgi:ferric-dicitrate binding protein FerR (iron transport regulator)
MEMPDGKQRHPAADLSEAALWYVRSKAKYLPTEEIHELSSWLRRSPQNSSAWMSIATRDRQRFSRGSATTRFAQALRHVFGADRAKSRNEHRSLSHRYFYHLKRKYLFPKLGLFAVTVCGLAAWVFVDDMRSMKIAAAAFVGLALLKVQEIVIGFRVVSGYFGSTESEVRHFIKFITAHYGDHAGQKEESALTKSALD